MTQETIDISPVWAGGSGELGSNWITGYVANVGTDGVATFVSWISGQPASDASVDFASTLEVLGVSDPAVDSGGVLTGSLTSSDLTIQNGSSYVLYGDLTMTGVNGGAAAGVSVTVGALSVVGAGSTLTLEGSAAWTNIDLNVGDFLGASTTNASLTISDGAAVSTTEGAEIDPGGTLTISGVGSSLELGGEFVLNVGDNDGIGPIGAGFLTIRDAGSLSTPGGIVVENGSTFTVVGIGSTLTAGILFVGGDGPGFIGAGLITISGAASASTGWVSVGQDGVGTLTISGVGSTLDTEGLSIGESYNGLVGAGLLTIDDGAFVSVGEGTTVTLAPNVFLGSPELIVGDSGSGTLVVSGTGTTLTAGCDLLVGGDGGTGLLTSSDGGLVLTEQSLSIASGSTVLVDSSSEIGIGTEGSPSAGVGALEVGAAGQVSLLGGSVVADTVMVDSGGIVEGYGTIDADVVNKSSVIASGETLTNGGTLDIEGDVTGSGAITIDSISTLEIDGSFAAGGKVDFNGSSGTLILDDLDDFDGTINGFATSNTIDVVDIQANTIAYDATSRLYLLEEKTQGQPITVVGSLDLAGLSPNTALTAQDDGNGGTDITENELWPTYPLVVTLESGGDWSAPDDDGDSTYTGTINIAYGASSDLLQVVGTVERQQNALVFSSTSAVYALIGGLTQPILTGAFSLYYATAATGTLSVGATFLAGFPMTITQIGLGPGGIELGYDLPLPDGFPDLSASAPTSTSAILLTAQGIQLGQTGSLSLPEAANVTIPGLFSASLDDLSIYTATNNALLPFAGNVTDIRASGAMTFQSPLRLATIDEGTEITADFSAPNSYLDFTNLASPTISFSGILKVEGNIALAPGWAIKSLTIGVNSANAGEVSLGGEIDTPLKINLAMNELGLSATVSVTTAPTWYFNGIMLGATFKPGFDIPDTPFFLTGLDAGLDNISPNATDPVELTGGFDLSLGPAGQTVGSVSFDLLTIQASATVAQVTVDSDPTLSGSMTATLLSLGNWSLASLTGNVSMDLQDGITTGSAGLTVADPLDSAVPLFSGSIAFRATSIGFGVDGTGTLTSPRTLNIGPFTVPVPPWMVLAATARFSLIDEYGQPLANQFATITGSFDVGGDTISAGFRIALNGSSFQPIGFSSVSGSASPLALSFSPTDAFAGSAADVADPQVSSPSYDIGAGINVLFLSATWTAPATTQPTYSIIEPDGTMVPQSGFAAVGITDLTASDTSTSVTVAVLNPTVGNWQLQLSDPDTLAGLTFDAETSVTPPVPSVADPVAKLDGSYSIGWTASNLQVDDTITFFADTQSSGEGGVPISAPMSASDSGSFVWDGSGVTPGSYYVYAEIDGGNAVTVDSYSSTPVTIDSVADLSLTVDTGSIVEGPSGASMTVTVDVTNSSTAAADDVIVVVQPPNGFQAAEQAGVVQDGGDWDVDLGAIVAGGTAVARVVFTASDGGSLTGQSVDFLASLSSHTFDAAPAASTSVDFGGTVNAEACFLAGTLIRNEFGEVPVERLAVGDRVVTWRGEVRPIVWIGRGKTLATRGKRTAATPVLVRKGALADNVPHHDLRITRAHSLFLDDVLIPVEFLVNHRSIEWDDRAQEVTIYHIELEAHDVVLANGAPAESYRDDGNRWLFHNANGGWDQPPKKSYAPVLTGGPVVDAVWRRLLDRAGPRRGLPLKDDPDLCLSVDGERINATSQHGSAHIFALPTRPTSVRIVSRAGAPAELGLARDPRVLGVAIRQIALRQGTRFRLMEAADASLTEGFHGFEPDGGLRWTDGDAALPAALFDGFDGPIELVLHVGATTHYPFYGKAAERSAA